MPLNPSSQRDVMTDADQNTILVHADVQAPNNLIGYAFDPDRPDEKLVLELLIDGYVRDVARAELPQERLKRGQTHDGCHGFDFALPNAITKYKHQPQLQLRLANTSIILLTLRYASPVDPEEDLFQAGNVRWDGGLRLVGMLAARAPGLLDQANLRLKRDFVVDSAHRWGAFRFDAALPFHLADGVPHVLRVLDDMGRELEGSPLTILAHTSGFAGVIETLADAQDGPPLLKEWGDYLDRLIPSSLPFESYLPWRNCFFSRRTAGVHARVLMLVFGAGPVPISGEPVSGPEDGLTFEQFAVAPEPDGKPISSETWAAVAAQMADFKPDLVVMLRAGSQLRPGWAAHLMAARPADNGTFLLYSDAEIVATDGMLTPILLPAFDATRWLTQCYPINLLALSPQAAMRLADVAPQSLPAAIIDALGVCDGSLDDSIVHVPLPLVTAPPLDIASTSQAMAAALEDVFGAVGLSAKPIAGAEVLPAVQIMRGGTTLGVDILIPTRDRLDLLEPCLDTLFGLTPPGNWSVTIIDNGSIEPRTREFLEQFERNGMGRVLRDDGPFNYARINNRAVAFTDQPLICFLNNDVEIVDAGWLDEMRSHFVDKEIAGVGARLLWPNGVVQHAGVVVGTGFAAGHAFDNHFASDAGHADGLLIARECSALTAACLVVRRTDFDNVGGFDEDAFPVAFNDVDLCLKLRTLGRRLIWTPHATLLHKESQSRGKEDSPEKLRRAQREIQNLRSRWGLALASDPYYHPSLNLSTHPFSGLAMPPRNLSPRRNRLKTP
jgi:O-antigen biosynthesis protein